MKDNYNCLMNWLWYYSDCWWLVWPENSERDRTVWCWWSCFHSHSCDHSTRINIVDTGFTKWTILVQTGVEYHLTCNKSNKGNILDKSPWLMIKKSATFQDWMFMDDLLSTQFLQAKYVAWSLRRIWTSSRNGNSSGSWAPWVTMSLRTSGRQRLFKWTKTWKYVWD